MRHYIDLDSGLLKDAIDFPDAARSISGVRGDTAAFDLVFCRAGIAVEIDASATLSSLRWGLKQDGHLLADYVVSNWNGTAYAWTKSGGAKFIDAVTVAAAFATATLTSDNTNVADGATVTIGGKTYTFRTVLSPAEGEVLIGANADASLLNLIRAINHTGSEDVDYSCASAHPQVSAAAAVSAHAFVITALVKGAAANALVTTETSTHLSFAGATMSGGVDGKTLTSATAGFASTDVGLVIAGSGITPGTTIISVESTTSCTLSAGMTASASGVTITFTGRTPVYTVHPSFNVVALNDLLIDGTIAGTPASQAARYALTGLAVGTIVRQTSDQTYWKVINALQLTNSAGWSTDVPTKDGVDLLLEIEWQVGGEIASTRKASFIADGDINRGTEGVPLSTYPSSAFVSGFTVRLGAAVTKSDDSLAAVPGLAIPIAANQALRIEYLLNLTDAANVGNFMLDFTAPGGAVVWVVGCIQERPYKTAVFTIVDLPFYDGTFAEPELCGRITVEVRNGPTAGQVDLLFAQYSTDAGYPATLSASGTNAIAFVLP